MPYFALTRLQPLGEWEVWSSEAVPNLPRPGSHQRTGFADLWWGEEGELKEYILNHQTPEFISFFHRYWMCALKLNCSPLFLHSSLPIAHVYVPVWFMVVLTLASRSGTWSEAVTCWWPHLDVWLIWWREARLVWTIASEYCTGIDFWKQHTPIFVIEYGMVFFFQLLGPRWGWPHVGHGIWATDQTHCGAGHNATERHPPDYDVQCHLPQRDSGSLQVKVQIILCTVIHDCTLICLHCCA